MFMKKSSKSESKSSTGIVQNESVDFKEFIEAVRQVGVFWAFINEVPQMSK
jgi:hypothetical protein